MTEIRNQIYSQVFVKPTYIGAIENRKGSAPRSKEFCAQYADWRKSSFAVSCRQVYHESSNIFFAQNGFEFSYARPALDFLMSIGARRRAMITKLKYHQNEAGRCFDVCRFFKSCTGLHELHVSWRVESRVAGIHVWWDFPVQKPLQFFLGKPTNLRIGKPQASKASKAYMIWEDLTRWMETLRLPPDSFYDHLLLVKREEMGEYKP